MLCLAIILTFYGEYNYVKDLNNIYTINKDMVDGVTAYQGANDDKPVAYFAAASTINASSTTDALFNARFDSTIAIKRKSYMVTSRVTERTGNNQKRTTCSNSWSTAKGTSGSNAACGGSYNNVNFASPCSASTGTSTNCDGTTIGTTITRSSTGATMFTINQNFLINDYVGRTTGLVRLVSEWGRTSGASPTISASTTVTGQWINCGNNIQYKMTSRPTRNGVPAQQGCYSNPASVSSSSASLPAGSIGGDRPSA